MKAQIVHDKLVLISHFAGRLRVRAEMFRVLPEVGEEVARQLSDYQGVTSADASPVTGSVLVNYDASAVQLPKLVTLIIRVGALKGIALEPSLAGAPSLTGGRRVRETLHAVNLQLNQACRGKLDLKVAVPAALTGTGFLVLAAGRRHLPQWYDLIFWGFVTFCNMNPHGEHRAAANDDARC
jgi:hypothetical protein